MQKPFNSQYYEAIIQLRPVNEDIFNYVADLVEKRKNVFVSKVITKKFGHDIYISDIRYALAIGKKLKTKFNGVLKTSRALYSYDRQTSKKKYRVVVCFRLNPFEKSVHGKTTEHFEKSPKKPEVFGAPETGVSSRVHGKEKNEEQDCIT